MNNFDRIHKEIQIEAKKIALENSFDPQAIITLVMHIVDLEDQHTFSAIHINQKVKSSIQKTALEQIIKD